MKWSQQLCAALWQAAPDAVIVSDSDGRVVLANDRAERLFGYGHGELVGCPSQMLVPEATPAFRAQLRDRSPAGDPGRPLRKAGMAARRKDGTEFAAEIWLTVVDTAQGEVAAAVIRDVSGHDQAAAGQAPVASIVQSSHDAIVAASLDGQILTFNQGAERLYGYRAEEVIGRDAGLLVPEAHRGDEREMATLVAEGARLERFPTERLRSDGRVVKVSLAISPLTAADGTIIGVVSTARDFSERERAEARLQEVLEAAPDGMIGVDLAGTIVLVNGQAEKIFGCPRHDLLGQPVTRLLPDGLTLTEGHDEDNLEPSSARRADGSRFSVEITTRVLDTDDGPVTCAAVRDITRRIEAAAEADQLRADAAEQRLQARLHRAQRLESLGQLAGGVAHDFNNLLAVILNYADFAADAARAHGEDLADLVADIDQIARAARHGSDLTHQLLAFARREITRPKVLDLNRAIGDIDAMLRRTIGEHITLTTHLTTGLPAITADPGQLEQVLVNLAVNARDAMRGGGHLTIDTAAITIAADDAARLRLTAGGHVRLRVTDTGAGMPREIIDRAFEPFFTTKPSGQGTGLGLATVYGIISQAGGTVQIYSEPGLGTTITILLPATTAAAAAAAVHTTTKPGHGYSEPRHSETVLLVEDEAPLREVTRRILNDAGYHVLPAQDGEEALAIASHHPGPIHLLLTDVVMPGMLGKEVARRITADQPATVVVYMSGYAQPVLASQGTLDPDTTLIEKPFTRAELLAAIRHQLDRQTTSH